MKNYTKHDSFKDFNETTEPNERYILGATTVLVYVSSNTVRTYIIDSLTESYLVCEEPA